MLEPKSNWSPVPASVLSVRLAGAHQVKLAWLAERLHMTKTEIIHALIEQEYAAWQGKEEE